MSQPIEEFCAQVAKLPQVCGQPGYVRAAQIREHLAARPEHFKIFSELLKIGHQKKKQPITLIKLVMDPQADAA